jgi:hypothetical protein
MPWSFYGIFIRARRRNKQEEESPSFQAQFLVTFRLSTERNVRRLVGAAVAQVQLLKAMGLGRLTCARGPRCGRVEPTSRTVTFSGKCRSFGFDGVDLG